MPFMETNTTTKENTMSTTPVDSRDEVPSTTVQAIFDGDSWSRLFIVAAARVEETESEAEADARRRAAQQAKVRRNDRKRVW